MRVPKAAIWPSPSDDLSNSELRALTDGHASAKVLRTLMVANKGDLLRWGKSQQFIHFCKTRLGLKIQPLDSYNNSLVDAIILRDNATHGTNNGLSYYSLGANIPINEATESLHRWAQYELAHVGGFIGSGVESSDPIAPSKSSIENDLNIFDIEDLLKSQGSRSTLLLLVNANEDDVTRWILVPMFQNFCVKVFQMRQSIDLPDYVRGTVQPRSSIELSLDFVNDASIPEGSPPDTPFLAGPLAGKSVTLILAHLQSYAQRLLDITKIPIRLEGKTIAWWLVEAWPSINVNEPVSMYALPVHQPVIPQDVQDRIVEWGQDYSLETLAGVLECERVLENRMSMNGFKLNIKMPNKVLTFIKDRFSQMAIETTSGSISTGCFMDENFFLPLVRQASRGEIEDGETVRFDFVNEHVVLHSNHDVNSHYIIGSGVAVDGGTSVAIGAIGRDKHA
ncbi:hypothetical protein CEK26_005725 [Fusarium fujikuroi]|uniref:Uncharacterized protein n=1 Tax=Fusarium fujikuroi TaxID=5127 RepID=A0A5Q3FPB5_FUSFU|nr:hypothetical protein CEK26_005725 [Fusarium fujikuroi]VTT65673.1 unnamed protein product [Fusarium fujikuroi]VTT70298.1 unnamed protein product [Fusarium fujikuroi]VZI16152.1 unnamed protein product [Fusarium fujikuroi]